MNEEKSRRIPCPKCGELMSVDARCCTHCGTLNPDFINNQTLYDNVQKSIKDYKAGKTPLLKERQGQAHEANNTGNRNFAFYVTYFLYLLMIAVTAFAAFSTGINSFDILIISSYPMTLVMLSILFLYIYSIELMFMKCNKPWWAGLVPIYNIMVLGDIAFHNKYIGLICFVPIIGQIFLLVILYKIGEKFKYNGMFTALLSIIFVPIIGFADHLYEDKVYVTTGDDRSLEKDYRNKKIFFSTLVLILVCGVALFIMGHIGQVRKTNKTIGGLYYAMAGRQTIRHVKSAVEAGDIICKSTTYDSSQGVYYIKYNDLGNNVFLPLYMMRDSISAYVKIDNDKEPREYYISMTDGKYGFSEILEKDVYARNVIEYTSLREVPTVQICEITTDA